MAASPDRPPAVGVVEVGAFAAAIVVLDGMEKAADIAVLQIELNDFNAMVLKVTGSPAALRAALDAASSVAGAMHAPLVATVLNAPDVRAWPAIESRPEHSPLIDRPVVMFPQNHPRNHPRNHPPKDAPPMEANRQAIGLIETQGFTAVIEAIDAACKAADVEVIAKEKLGGGYITVLIQGDVAAVKAAVEAGKAHVGPLGKLIAAHVIARPSDSLLKLLTRV